MKQTIFDLTVLITLVACDNPDTAKVKGRQTEQAADSAKNKLDRNVLIEESKNFTELLAPMTKKKLRAYLSFQL